MTEVSLFGLQVLAVIAGFNALGPPQRGIVEVDPSGRHSPVVERDEGFSARVETGVGLGLGLTPSSSSVELRTASGLSIRYTSPHTRLSFAGMAAG